LEVRDLTVRYGGTTAVDSVSLSVKPGQIVGLIGPNGAGKTTLVDAVTGFTKPAEGTLVLDGRDIARWSPVRRARAGVGRSFQSLELFEDATVFDNLRAASDPRDIVSYLRDLVWPVAPPIPGQVVSAINEFRLQDDLNRPVESLPYGQRRLLAIARAVATGPSVLLLDEPAAGLGELESSELAHLVRRLASDWGIGILLVEHDMDFVMSVCDELVVLDFGRKIAEGPPEVVRNDPAVIAAYLGEEEPDAAVATDTRPRAAILPDGATEGSG
jgi:sulfate-transporting ATPase